MSAPGDVAARGRVELRGVGKRFRVDGRELTVLDGIDLVIEPGEFVTILGASGCGKSTLLRLLAGLEHPDAGEVRHDGRAIAGTGLERGLVFQEPRLFPWLTVAENVAAALLNAPLDADAKRRAVAGHIAMVGLGGFERAYPHQLSGGMAQRVAIARGLVNRPGLLLLDEPFGALDAFTREQLQDELRALQAREGFTTVLVTHDVEEALYLGDRVVVMSPRPGRIRAVIAVPLGQPRDRADELLGRLHHAARAALRDTLPLAA
ncbi:ABC transporter ATP-binding protein [Roseomonas sp. NAR14]|uniref:ABC transporter ATP-binding protein n=1 Tax=Roseomonas acroporae TaxID=2937791 RepID=A0A9X1YBE4_9PROT|nr:ABC transporter ATP-binding protein [Roseomonas acroporae]MCK8786996.1 ABC transporter ATP-binding protein [Roseomonas acroporae]